MHPLDGLDEEQRAAAEAVHGPVAILAGAGTGKTRAITHRIAHAVGTGEHDARRSLAVTFTTRAAGEMRTRLYALGVDGVQVRTFHAAALRQLRYFWPRLSSGSFPELISSKAKLVAEAAHRCGVATDSATIRDLSGDLEWAKVNFLEGSAIGARALDINRTLSIPASELVRVRSAYEDIKEHRGVLDFEDVLLVTVGALSTRPDIADEVRATYRWFTVDEFQDVNPLQHRLLSLWLGDRDDVCVVGDASQTIYSFTGASPQYLLDFRKTYPDATEVRLVRCYRCTPEIIELANGVIAVSSLARPLLLRSERSAGDSPEIVAYDDDVAEAEQTAARARTLIESGVAARDIAVLFRVNAQSAALEEAFAEAGIPVVLRGTERFFDRPEVREAITRMRGAARAGEGGASLGDGVRAVLSAAGWTPQAPTTAGAVRERWESLSALVSLADELGEALDHSLPNFISELDTRADLQHAPVADGVTLSSVHSAKGLEWSAVFVVGCSEGLIPLQYAETPEQIEEERRLMYVAITRAADRLVLSWAHARNPGGRASRVRSRFLDRLGLRTGADAPQIHRGGAKAREELRRTGPARCRVCRKGLVSAEERTLGRCRSCPSNLNEPLLEALRAWRLRESRDAEVPAFVVFTDRTLLAIAEQQPGDMDALADIPGVGPAKLERYAQSVLRMVEDNQRDG